MHLPTYNNELLNFAFWLFKKENGDLIKMHKVLQYVGLE